MKYNPVVVVDEFLGKYKWYFAKNKRNVPSFKKIKIDIQHNFATLYGRLARSAISSPPLILRRSRLPPRRGPGAQRRRKHAVSATIKTTSAPSAAGPRWTDRDAGAAHAAPSLRSESKTACTRALGPYTACKPNTHNNNNNNIRVYETEDGVPENVCVVRARMYNII